MGEEKLSVQEMVQVNECMTKTYADTTVIFINIIIIIIIIFLLSDSKAQEGLATHKNTTDIAVHVYDSIDPEYAVIKDNTMQKSTSTTFTGDSFCFTECEAYSIPGWVMHIYFSTLSVYPLSYFHNYKDY